MTYDYRFPLSFLSLVGLSACFTPNLAAQTDTDSETSSTTGATMTGPQEVSTDPATSATTPGTTAQTTEDSTTTEDPTETSEEPTTDPEKTTTDSDSSTTDGETTAGPTTSDDTGATTGSIIDDCGDGDVTGDEVCDDGINDGAYDGCEPGCMAFGPFCGDGETHASEVCDDGDAVEGNGCNTNCIESGTELWTRQAHVGATDACQDVVRTPSGATYAIAQVPDLDGESWARAYWVRKYLADGTAVWTREYAPFGDVAPHDYIATAGTAVGEDVVVGGGHRTSQLGTVFEIPLVRLASATGALVWDRADDHASQAGDLVVAGGEIVVGGRPTAGNASAFYRITLAGQSSGAAVDDASVDPRGLAVDDAGNVLVVGADDGGDAVVQVRDGSLSTISVFEYPTLDEPRGIGPAPGGGRVLGGVGGPAWVRMTNAAGAEVWTTDEDSLAALGTVEDVAVTETGSVLVVGTRSGSPWIARLGVDGELLWSRAPDEDGVFLSVVWDAAGDVTACGRVDAGGEADNIYVARYTE